MTSSVCCVYAVFYNCIFTEIQGNFKLILSIEKIVMGFMLTLCKHAWPIVHADYEKFMNTMPYYSIISA